MSEENKDDKTEAPSSRRIEKAREEGDIPRSRELTSMLLLLTGLLALSLTLPMSWQGMLHIVRYSWQFDLSQVNAHQWGAYSVDMIPLSLWLFLPFGLSLWVVAIIANVIIGGVNLSPKALQVKFSRLNPLSGMKKFYSAQTGAELLKSLLKACIVISILLTVLWLKQREILGLIHQPSQIALKEGAYGLVKLWLWVVMGMMPMVAFDLFWQLYSYHKKLRMSRQEIRDEHKQQEGDPHLKGRIRQQMRAAARQRMMANVPRADVILTNPTHFAIALLYQEGKMLAPQVVAKGRGQVAEKIRALGNSHHIPTLEAPPLARALWRHTEVGDPIPGALYTAVAEVLAWVWQVRRWRKMGGQKPERPQQLVVPAEMTFDLESDDDE
ncbi:flagellar biosynthesis protein FlhB [Tatumella ptyseos]|uniref:flagellar biosynthesis protein FlhB n=1 Tax=Tatumella ptyseos TaxID=82987 RepID=UPI0026F0F3EA|nr:flagellar biosynthesis protein FlhB [Tatumella ptyseos]WKX25352.1 flagellar biosynthesis protein FlhB [Tatumella ptyseos]